MYILLILMLGEASRGGVAMERVEGFRTLALCEEAAKTVGRDFANIYKGKWRGNSFRTSCIRVKDGSDE